MANVEYQEVTFNNGIDIRKSLKKMVVRLPGGGINFSAKTAPAVFSDTYAMNTADTELVLRRFKVVRLPGNVTHSGTVPIGVTSSAIVPYRHATYTMTKAATRNWIKEPTAINLIHSFNNFKFDLSIEGDTNNNSLYNKVKISSIFIKGSGTAGAFTWKFDKTGMTSNNSTPTGAFSWSNIANTNTAGPFDTQNINTLKFYIHYVSTMTAHITQAITGETPTISASYTTNLSAFKNITWKVNIPSLSANDVRTIKNRMPT